MEFGLQNERALHYIYSAQNSISVSPLFAGSALVKRREFGCFLRCEPNRIHDSPAGFIVHDSFRKPQPIYLLPSTQRDSSWEPEHSAVVIDVKFNATCSHRFPKSIPTNQFVLIITGPSIHWSRGKLFSHRLHSRGCRQIDRKWDAVAFGNPLVWVKCNVAFWWWSGNVR